MTHPARPARRAAATILALTIPLATAACDGDLTTTATAAGGHKPPAKTVTQARKNLARLRTASASGHGYDRREFGTRWKDTDHNGCDQRNDILARDLTKAHKTGRCVVTSGKLNDPYSGKTLLFTKKAAATVQIDHVYPLALAWRMGASRWSKSRRETFANDHANLLAVWGVPNRAKSDSGPGDWMPHAAYRCAYAVRYVAVASKYALPVTRGDRAALRAALTHC